MCVHKFHTLQCKLNPSFYASGQETMATVITGVFLFLLLNKRKRKWWFPPILPRLLRDETWKKRSFNLSNSFILKATSELDLCTSSCALFHIFLLAQKVIFTHIHIHNCFQFCVFCIYLVIKSSLRLVCFTTSWFTNAV